MAPTNEFEIHDQCERLVYKFLQLLEGEQTKTADLFTEDGQAFELVGREKIREHFAGIDAVDDNVNVLLCSNLLIDVDDEDHARATNYVTHYVADREAEALTDPEGRPRRWRAQYREVDHPVVLGVQACRGRVVDLQAAISGTGAPSKGRNRRPLAGIQSYLIWRIARSPLLGGLHEDQRPDPSDTRHAEFAGTVDAC